MSLALKLEAWLGLAPGPHRIGQVAVLAEGGAYALRHADDREAAAGTLRTVDGLAALRQIVKFDAAGAFRPLRGAPTLQRGWRMERLSPGALREALDIVYPAAAGLWAAWREGTLEVTEFPETARRQTGMYRITQVMTDAQLRQAVEGVCRNGCLRRRLWRPEPEARLRGAEEAFPLPGAAEPKSLPLLCPEACNYFIAQARERIVAERKEEDEAT